MLIVNKADAFVKEITRIANDDKHGYSQLNRWGTDYDCSSLIITVVQNCGINVKTSGASFTGNMLPTFKRCGFSDVKHLVNLVTGDGLISGDILLTPYRHTEMYVGRGLMCGAHSDENKGKEGKQTGDQTGHEISTVKYYNADWQHVLRYTGIVLPKPPKPTRKTRKTK